MFIHSFFFSFLVGDMESLVSSITDLFADIANGDTGESRHPSTGVNRPSPHLSKEPMKSISYEKWIRSCQTVVCFKVLWWIAATKRTDSAVSRRKEANDPDGRIISGGNSHPAPLSIQGHCIPDVLYSNPSDCGVGEFCPHPHLC